MAFNIWSLFFFSVNVWLAGLAMVFRRYQEVSSPTSEGEFYLI